MLKKLATLTFSFFIFASFAPLGLAHTYEDVPQGSKYFYPVDYLRRNDVFMDTKYFYPDTLISKAEYIKYLVLLNRPGFKVSPVNTLPFKDVRLSSPYAPYIKEAINLGVLDERQENIYPDAKLTLLEATRLLFHSQSIPIPNVYYGKPEAIPYKDVRQNTASIAMIMRALELDLIEPQSNDNFGIYRRVTRAEAARMIYKLDLATIGGPTSNGLPGVSNYGPELQKIISVWEIVENDFIGKKQFDRGSASDQALKSLIESLNDPYSRYMDEEEFRNFNDNSDGDIEGIGAVIGYNEAHEVTVISPLEGSPAKSAGLQANDVILEIDGRSAAGMTIEEAVTFIKGPTGTTVELKIRRNKEIKTLTIERAIIEIVSVEYKALEDESIYKISVSQFNAEAAERFRNAVSVIKANPKVKGLILDLRGNPGGLLDVSVAIAGHFVEGQKQVVSINYPEYKQELLSRGQAELKSYPLVVLIDGGSASASEILAGVLQDYDLGTLIGETSYGKGTVQALKSFPDESTLKLTVANWLTPLRQDIDKNGITPDIVVIDDQATERDEQLERAIAELKKMMAQ